jgi:hypothetical protein
MVRLVSLVTLALGLLAVSSPALAAQSTGMGALGRVAVPVEAQRNPLQRPLRQWRLPERRGPSQEPAAARGYADGYQRGVDDGRDKDRYDAVGHANYKSADAGYDVKYGSKDAYRNNYRAGFRQGYEDGYRDGSRGRR